MNSYLRFRRRWREAGVAITGTVRDSGGDGTVSNLAGIFSVVFFFFFFFFSKCLPLGKTSKGYKGFLCTIFYQCF